MRGRRHAQGGGKPAGAVAPRELVLGARRLALVQLLDRGEQHLLDGALDRAQGQALLHQPVGLGLVEAPERVMEARRRRGALARARARARSPTRCCASPRTPRAAPRPRRGRTAGARPAFACGFGYPKRRSQLRNVFGLTPRIPAAAFVRMTLMGRFVARWGIAANAARKRARAASCRRTALSDPSARSGSLSDEILAMGRPGLEPGTSGLTCRTGSHRPRTWRCACGLDHLFALDSTLGRAAYGL